MYPMKPVVGVPSKEQISCLMYKIKNFHEQRELEAKADGIPVCGIERDLRILKLLSEREMESYINKQKQVHFVLEQLQQRLNKLIVYTRDKKENEPISKKKSVVPTTCNIVSEQCLKESKSEKNIGIKNLINEDTVVFANPVDPPYSLLALPLLWPTVSWDISYHVHSTIVEDLKELETMKLFKNVSSKDKKKTVKVFVIWQHINSGPKIMRSSTDVIVGEASLLWLFNKFLATETTISTDQTNSDKVMTLINEVSLFKNDRTSELYNIINDSTITLDVKNVAVWSLLFKKNKSPPRIKKWIEQITKIIVN